jgi:tRNA A-37 threonylcarbamoyl transferase component Bud32
VTVDVSAPQTFEELRILLLASKRIEPEDRIIPLTGGVSALVAIVQPTSARNPWVVKSPLAKLAVRDEWFVDRTRGTNEAAALQLLGGELGPLQVPRLLFFDPRDTVLGLEMMVSPSPTYKDELLAGRVDTDVAADLGLGAAALHRLPPGDVLSGPKPRQLFDALRLDPYYRATAVKRPELAPALQMLTEETVAATPHRLVHGDLTPKNVLLPRDGRTVLVDWEVAHGGDASFDMATLTAHLTLKSLRDGASLAERAALLASVDRFWKSYDGPADRVRALRHTGAVVLARLFGKSPVEYLTGDACREMAYVVGRSALQAECQEIDDFLALVASAIKEGTDA